ncbi:AMP-binding protein [Croceicoccus sp. F390]|uniref:AMP-binding protein n=1 Tax=Croceicoccus esteveae TaxID=3075597 RepID=A0ABU2ZEP1_9SPHN|nr:AMP-binding protein [Croceicoccus sp. F390]MDT0574671.1 AMP-binding protein [Croceicoccus sp. F390]
MSKSDPIFNTLTAPGTPFAIGVQDGMRRFVNAAPNLNAFIETARRHGDKTFIVEGDRRISFAELFTLRDALVARMGMQNGNRVAICMSNRAEWLIAFVAVIRAGGIAALVNSRGAPAELREAIESVTPTLVLADERRAQLLKESGYKGAILKAQDFPETGAAPAEQPSAGANDPCTILFTSGTTGKVKGAVLSHANVVQGLMSVQLSGLMVLHGMAQQYNMTIDELLAMVPQQGSLLVSPLFHISGLGAAFLSPLVAGSKVVLMPRWDGQEAAQLIEREQVTLFSGVPTMFWDVLHAAAETGADLSSLRNIASGGQALPVNILDELREACPQAILGTGYGMTETSGSVSMAVGADFIRKRSSAGRVLAIVDMRVEDAEGNVLPPGEPGELVVHGPVVMQGYWENPEETAKCIGGDGWLRTGDIGIIDDEGYVFIVDRKKDMVISGGENIFCAEVERVIGHMAGVAECATFGVPDERMGEALVAIVRTDEPVSAEQISSAVGQELAKYKIPTAIRFIDEPLPRNPVGKIDKIALRKLWPQLCSEQAGS